MEFFSQIEKITVKDELAKLLGVGDGIFTYSYYDIVKATGHSCLTVAGAYLTALEGLKELYRGEIPKRGEIKVEISKLPTDNNYGVVGFVLSIITGASDEKGFSGLPGGKLRRRGLLSYGAKIPADVAMTRLDTGKKVGINYRPASVVNLKEIFNLYFQGKLDEFSKHFQNSVKKVLENKDKVIKVFEI